MRVASRFNGPPGSGHGGYTCGLVAALLGGGPARISLRSPPPLDRDMRVRRRGRLIEVRDDKRLVAAGIRAELNLQPTEPIDVERAVDASRDGYERWATQHPFPGCFACGPARDHGDGLRLFPGPLGDGRLAVAWTPDATLANPGGMVEPEYVWAALDCPSSAPVAEYGRPVAVLARLHTRIDRPLAAGAPHAIVAWPLAIDGRKRQAGCAIFDAEGRALAVSHALWIELAEESRLSGAVG